MIVFLILLLVAVAVLGVFAFQNAQAEEITFLAFHWHHVPVWVPPVLTGGVVAALLILYMLYAGARHGLHSRGLRRTIGGHESSIEELQAEVGRLRSELELTRR
ncbi:MAG: hypothetical protein M3024_08050 [Candidatus Dormibacteraeota bacterium]|nr:hypothetical protein [Candidatus Dormibacteraeota bacterium]